MNVSGLPDGTVYPALRRLESLAAYRGIPVEHNSTGLEEPELVRGIDVSVDLFPVLRVRPSVGRGFSLEEGRRGSEPIVNISDGLWRRRFGAGPGLVGEIIELSVRAHTVVGVMPRDFRFEPDVDLWTPMQPELEATDHAHGFKLPGRLKPEVSLEAANASFARLAELSERGTPGTSGGDRVHRRRGVSGPHRGSSSSRSLGPRTQTGC